MLLAMQQRMPHVPQLIPLVLLMQPSWLCTATRSTLLLLLLMLIAHEPETHDNPKQPRLLPAQHCRAVAKGAPEQ